MAGDNKDVELLTEHEKKRAIIKRSRRNDGQRQQDTLDKLLAFKSASAPLLRGAPSPYTLHLGLFTLRPKAQSSNLNPEGGSRVEGATDARLSALKPICDSQVEARKQR